MWSILPFQELVKLLILAPNEGVDEQESLLNDLEGLLHAFNEVISAEKFHNVKRNLVSRYEKKCDGHIVIALKENDASPKLLEIFSIVI